MTPYCTGLSSMTHHISSLVVHTGDGSSLSIVGKDTFLSGSFIVPDVSYVPELTMQLMLAS
jgi:hypothetical protein